MMVKTVFLHHCIVCTAAVLHTVVTRSLLVVKHANDHKMHPPIHTSALDTVDCALGFVLDSCRAGPVSDGMAPSRGMGQG